jgi:hypothetical protein
MNESAAAAAAVAYIAKRERERLENTSHYMPVLFLYIDLPLEGYNSEKRRETEGLYMYTRPEPKWPTL